jgi:hypothetical protein
MYAMSRNGSAGLLAMLDFAELARRLDHVLRPWTCLPRPLTKVVVVR